MGKRKWQVKRKNGKEKEEIMWKRKTEKKRERKRAPRRAAIFAVHIFLHHRRPRTVIFAVIASHRSLGPVPPLRATCFAYTPYDSN